MTPRPTACLVFKTKTDLISCAAASVGIELVGEGLTGSEGQLVREAATAVLHYFRNDLGRESVAVGEFASVLARVLRGFGLDVESCLRVEDPAAMVEADLSHLVAASGGTFELGFYQRLREELARRLEPRPLVVRFTGLRVCVKTLVGARRWSGRCEALSDQIIEYLRRCLRAEERAGNCALVIV